MPQKLTIYGFEEKDWQKQMSPRIEQMKSFIYLERTQTSKITLKNWLLLIKVSLHLYYDPWISFLWFFPGIMNTNFNRDLIKNIWTSFIHSN
jgi:hypothetical protein